MSRDYQVIFSGEGGQGLVVTGTLLGQAAVVHEGRYATQTVDYGIASRGGFAMAEVRLSDEDIDCPELTRPDYIVALTPGAYRRFENQANESVIIYDSDQITPDATHANCHGVPLTTRLRELVGEHGDRARINVLALGAVLGMEPLVSEEAMAGAFCDQFGERGVEVNLAVLRAGMEMTAGRV